MVIFLLFQGCYQIKPNFFYSYSNFAIAAKCSYLWCYSLEDFSSFVIFFIYLSSALVSFCSHKLRNNNVKGNVQSFQHRTFGLWFASYSTKILKKSVNVFFNLYIFRNLRITLISSRQWKMSVFSIFLGDFENCLIFEAYTKVRIARFLRGSSNCSA